MRTYPRTILAAAAAALALPGCVIVPQGTGAMPAGIYIPSDLPAAMGRTAAPPAGAQAAAPVSLSARLYPANETATEVGMLSGSVTNMMNGKGRLQLQYRGELLAGEATRVSGDERKGIASAYGPSGSFMSCEYQMSSPVRGAGTCSFSDGARYQVHIGN